MSHFDRSKIDDLDSPSASAIDPLDAADDSSLDDHVAGTWIAGMIGVLLSATFYAAVTFVPWAPLERYFLGHPVAIAATILFWFGVGVLLAKFWNVTAQWSRLNSIRDAELTPEERTSNSPANHWRGEHDAGYVAASWLDEIRGLPQVTRRSCLVRRLEELLTRQSQRGTTKHLGDDLRELSARDADESHDSFGLVRIIVWAIPMLGFLGTVIGITQTLGGLDFTDGTAAVERLKSGLYIAFDTTALGLVLSVVAIFIQFPIERSEQQLLAAIDARVGHLISTHLPSDEAADNQTALVADLCEGIRAAVAESLSSQAQLWRETIDEAQQQWQSLHDGNANKIADAFQETLHPAPGRSCVDAGNIRANCCRSLARAVAAVAGHHGSQRRIVGVTSSHDDSPM